MHIVLACPQHSRNTECAAVIAYIRHYNSMWEPMVWKVFPTKKQMVGSQHLRPGRDHPVLKTPLTSNDHHSGRQGDLLKDTQLATQRPRQTRLPTDSRGPATAGAAEGRGGQPRRMETDIGALGPIVNALETVPHDVPTGNDAYSEKLIYTGTALGYCLWSLCCSSVRPTRGGSLFE